MKSRNTELVKKIIIITLWVIIVAALLFMYLSQKQKKEQETLNKALGEYSAYYSGEFDISDYQFVDKQAVVIKWQSKHPKEDRIINKYGEQINDWSATLATSGEKYIVRENVKLKAWPKYDGFKRNQAIKDEYWNLDVYEISDKRLIKKTYDVFKMVREYSKYLKPMKIDNSIRLYQGKEVIGINLGYIKNGKETADYDHLIDLETGKIIKGKTVKDTQGKFADIRNYPLAAGLGNKNSVFQNTIQLLKGKSLSKSILFASKYPKAFKWYSSSTTFGKEYPTPFRFYGKPTRLYVLSFTPNTTLYTKVIELFYPTGTNIYTNYSLDSKYSNDGQEHSVNSYEEFMKYYNVDSLYHSY